MRKNKVKILAQRARKQRLILAVILIAFLYLFSQILSIYLVYGDDYRRQTIRQQALEGGIDQFIMPNRGNIMDRNGQLLAIGSSVYNVIIDVRLMHDSIEGRRVHDRNRAKAALEVLEEYLDLEEGRLESYFEINPETGRPARDTNYLILVRHISPVLAQNFVDHFPFIVLEEDTIRTYPRGYLTSNIIGFLSGDGNHWGLEREYDIELSGIPGRRIRQFTDRGVAQTNEFMPQTGHALLTTLDIRLQESVLEILTEYANEYEVRRAMAIVMDPNTGEVITMAQYPSFNNAAPSYIGDVTSLRTRERLRELEGADRTEEFFRVWANSNINYSFQPGSMFKPLIAAAAFEERVITVNDTFYCPGYVIVAGERINCWSYNILGRGHGHLTLSDAMAASCNTAIIQIGNRLGRENFYNWLRDFGVGQLTGIDIFGEASAFTLTYTYNQLNPVELATSSMGQGFNMTAIQSLNSFNAVINGGYLMRPFVVSSVVDNDGIIISENEPKVVRNLLSQETSDFWRTEMERTISWQGGTGTAAKMDGIPAGGKTGTGEQARGSGREEWANSFITYLPVENPQYSVLVTLYVAEPGGIPQSLPSGVISSLAREVMEQIVVIRGVNTGNTVPSFKTTAVVEDYIGMTSGVAVNRVHEKGLRANITGSGNVVTSQHPAEGEMLPIGTEIFLFLEEITDDEEAPRMVLVPNLVGLDTDTATYILIELGLEYAILYDPDAENLQGIITSQMPAENFRIGEGTTVTIIIE